MKSALLFPLRLFLFWLLFFALFRLWFVLWFHAEWSPEAPSMAWASFWHALPLDLSMAGYLCVIPVLFWFTGLAIGRSGFDWAQRAILIFNTIVFSILVFVFGANVFIYEEWHTLLNNRALEYFKTPAALLDSMSLPFKAVCVLLYVGFVWLIYVAYCALAGRKLFDGQPGRAGLMMLPVWLALLVLAIRGGLGVMPINESAVYFSPHIFDNHAATNTAWHLIHSMVETRSTENHYRFMTPEEAEKALEPLIHPSNVADSESFVVTGDSSPLNLMFVIMESHTAQVVESLGGEPGVCPNLEKLIRDGVLFTNCYGSGYRTDQGIVSVLAGYPAQPDQSIVLLEDKAVKLNSMSKQLKQQGYSTAFFYGGELTFANIGAWLTNQRFDRVFSEKDFAAADLTQRWGVDDRILLQRAVAEVSALKQPFFATAMTLSLHPPYDVPFESRWKGATDREKFLNSAAFADDAIGDFFESASKQPWFDRTVFVLVADHGSSMPGGIGLDNPASRHIPLIVWGKPLKETVTGKKIDVFCNHHDIPAMVSHIMNWEPHPLLSPWSLDKMRWQATEGGPAGFAYFTNENGIGWVNGRGKGFYYFADRSWKNWEGNPDSVTEVLPKAYLQLLYEDFLQK